MSDPTQPVSSSVFRSWRPWALASLPIVAALAVHGVSLGHGFIADDNLLILGNRQITGPGSLRDILLSDWFNRAEGGAIGYYRPVSKLSLFLTYRLAGPNPLAFHLGNLLAHVLAAAVLFVVGRRLFGREVAAVAATIFAVHPATAQAVGVITARPDVLGILFALSTCAAFLAWKETGARKWLAAALVAWLLALGSKESTLLLSLALFPLALSLGATVRSAARSTAPFLALTALTIGLRLALFVTPIPNALAQLSLLGRLLAVLKAVGSYLAPLALGRPIVALPHLPNGVFDPFVVFGALTCAAGLAVLASRPRTPVAFAVAFGALAAGPALAVWLLHIPMWAGAIPIAERWLYGPAAAEAMIVAALLVRVRSPVRHLLGGALVLLLATIATQRVLTLRSVATFSAFAAEQYRAAGEETLFPNERYLLHYHEGLALSDAGKHEEAAAAFAQAQVIAPWMGEAREAMARLDSKRGLHAAAETGARTLLSSEFWADDRGRRERAAFGSDAELRIDRPALHEIVGRSLASRAEWAGALAEFDTARKLGAGSQVEHQYAFDQGVALEAMGRLSEARGAFETAQRLEPTWFGPAVRLALLDRKEGLHEQATRRLEEVIRGGGEGEKAARRLLER